MNKKTKSRAYLLAIFVVFFAPLFYAMWLFYSPSKSLDINTQNHGELIQPPRPLKEFFLVGEKNYYLSSKDLEGKWTLLYLGNETCSLYCEADLFKMRQVRLSLGRDSHRVQKMYIALTYKISVVENNPILSKYTDMQITIIDREKFYNFLPQFKNLTEKRIYIIDPFGNIMMTYSKGSTAKGMKKDLKRLLKVSKIG